jgi:uncharacterized protein YbjT (DUF2867 family)
MFLVIGATGPTGSETARRLLERGEAVRVLTRDRAKAEAMPALAGAEIAVGDCSRPGSVDHVFEGADKVYLVPPTAVGWDRMEAALIDAARRAGVRHVVKLSAIGVDRDEPSMSLSYHWRGEQAVERSGIPFTVVRGNSFFQNTLFEAATIRAEGKFYDCVGTARFAKVDTRDIGEVVAKVLTEPGHEGETYELTGPEALGYADMAERLTTALGRKIEYVDVSTGERAARLEAAGLPDWMAAEFSNIYGRGFYGDDGGAYTTGAIETLLGRPPRAYGDFARDYAEALS